jgi:hypothetical protein
VSRHSASAAATRARVVSYAAESTTPRLAAAQVQPDARVVVELLGVRDRVPPVDAGEAVQALEPPRRAGEPAEERGLQPGRDDAQRGGAREPGHPAARGCRAEAEEPARREAAVQVDGAVTRPAAPVIRHDGDGGVAGAAARSRPSAESSAS